MITRVIKPFTRRKPSWGSLWPWTLEQIRNRYAGRELPSLKAIAVDLGVSPNTVIKALRHATPGEQEAWAKGDPQ